MQNRLRSISLTGVWDTKDERIKQRAQANESTNERATGKGCSAGGGAVAGLAAAARERYVRNKQSTLCRQGRWWPTKKSISIMINDQNSVYFLRYFSIWLRLPTLESQYIYPHKCITCKIYYAQHGMQTTHFLLSFCIFSASQFPQLFSFFRFFLRSFFVFIFIFFLFAFFFSSSFLLLTSAARAISWLILWVVSLLRLVLCWCFSYWIHLLFSPTLKA